MGSSKQSDIARRRQRLENALELENEILLVGAGEPVPLPESSDQVYPFRAHSDYFYLTGIDSPGGIVAFDPKAPGRQRWVSFVPDVTEAERTWEGRVQPNGKNLAALEAWLARRRGRPIVNLGASLRGVRADDALTAHARERSIRARRAKDKTELDLLRRAADATAKGFAAVRNHIRAGATERALQIELETGFLRGGADRSGFATIVGSGPNSAILHFAPSQRIVRRGEFVLIDAGAEVGRYTADVTRTYIAGKGSSMQRDMYQLVLAVEKRALSRCVAGAEWKDIHLKAATELTAGLVDMKWMYGNAETLVEQGAHTLFFPHGIGHLVGLGVRDASGREPGRPKDESEALKNLRMDLALAAGYVTTIEPGLYFIPAILNDRARRKRYRKAVNWKFVDRHIRLGGVRIEDTVLVTNGRPENLTADIPK